MSKRRKRLPLPGTIGAERLAIRNELDAMAQKAEALPDPAGALLHAMAGEALAAARDIAKAARGMAMTAEGFATLALRLGEALPRAWRIVRDGVGDRWPTTPGTCLSWHAGDSALEAALMFADGVLGGVAYGNASAGLVNHYRRERVPFTDPRLAAWRDATLAELCKHALPAPPAWPTWEIERDVGRTFSLMQAEFERLPGEAVDDDGAEQGPALTKAERLTLLALSDIGVLASVDRIAEAMPDDESITVRTVGPAVRKLIENGLAERPEGERQGARLTPKGRRLARKIAD